jgi:hypothetical protein
MDVEKEWKGYQEAKVSNVTYLSLKIDDDGNEDIGKHFEPTNQLLKEIKNLYTKDKTSRILVHCYLGSSRYVLSRKNSLLSTSFQHLFSKIISKKVDHHCSGLLDARIRTEAEPCI